jgi:hypothetical protein
MVKASESLKFALEAAHQFRAGESRLQDFDRYFAARLVLFGFVNGAHAAFAKQANDALVADLREFPVGGGRRGGGRRSVDRKRSLEVRRLGLSVRGLGFVEHQL